jgi:hypothetical protein
MSKTRTVLVLGAGASQPYWFPTGAELRNIIVGSARSQRELGVLSRMLEIGHDPAKPYDQYDTRDLNSMFQAKLFEAFKLAGIHEAVGSDFRTRFKLSELWSIDAFLTRNRTFEDAGKVAIALVLLLCEHEEHLEGNWYRTLWNLIAPYAKGAVEWVPLIVTFNYERSLEMYLKRSYINTVDGAQHDDANQFIDLLRIVHVYGSLGDLDIVPYGFHEVAGSAAQYIKLLRKDASSDFEDEIRKAIEPEGKVIFLGFGFDRLNLDVLGLNLTGSHRCYASTLGLSHPTKSYALQKIPFLKPSHMLDLDVESFLHQSDALS